MFNFDGIQRNSKSILAKDKMFACIFLSRWLKSLRVYFFSFFIIGKQIYGRHVYVNFNLLCIVTSILFYIFITHMMPRYMNKALPNIGTCLFSIGSLILIINSFFFSTKFSDNEVSQCDLTYTDLYWNYNEEDKCLGDFRC